MNLYKPSAGMVEVAGPDSRDYLHRMLTCNLKKLAVGQVIPGALLNALGRPLAIFWCWALESERFLLQTPEACREQLAATLDQFIFTEAVTVNVVAGHLWQLINPDDAPALGTIITTANGYLAHPREVFFWSPHTELTGSLVPEEDIEAQRILNGWPAWGKELSAQQIPLGLGWDKAFDHHKGCYTGQEVISRLTFVGHPPYLLVGLKPKELLRDLPLPVVKDGESIGFATSFARSITQGPVALARIRHGKIMAGDLVQIGFESSVAEATVSQLFG